MSFSHVTFPVDSRFINAAIFVLFDVIVFNIIAVALGRVQATLVQRRLRHGNRVKLRESNLSSYVGGLMCDTNVATRVLMLLHLAMLLLLFLLTLGVNGRTERGQVPATRRYITRIAADSDIDYRREKSHPRMFGSCVLRSNASILFYPTAFDTVGDRTGPVELADLFAMRDENDKRVNIDVPNMLCQNFGQLPPMLVVHRCGDIPETCDNLEIGGHGTVEILPAQNSTRRSQHSVVLYTGNPDDWLLVMHRIVRVVEPVDSVKDPIESAKEYNILICKERPIQGEEKPHDHYYFNCVIGKWNDEDSVFTFRLGQASFERDEEKLKAVKDVHKSLEMNFFLTSAEIEIEWDVAENGDSLIADGLAVVGQDLITGQNFLNEIISRSIVAQEVGSEMVILSEKERLVTDVATVALVLYILLLLVAVVCMLSMWLLLRSNKHVGFVDVTTFTGVTALLRREIGCKEPFTSDWTEFGIASSHENDKVMYRLRALRDDEEAVELPSTEMVVV